MVDEYWGNLSDAERESWSTQTNLINTIRNIQ
jgi:hypothetical protein